LVISEVKEKETKNHRSKKRWFLLKQLGVSMPQMRIRTQQLQAQLRPQQKSKTQIVQT